MLEVTGRELLSSNEQHAASKLVTILARPSPHFRLDNNENYQFKTNSYCRPYLSMAMKLKTGFLLT